jgi:predicted neuraminidase
MSNSEIIFHAEEIFERKGLGGSSHGSTITEGPDGTLYAVWYSGLAEKAADVKVFMSKKPKGGKWENPWLIEKEGETSKNPFIMGEEDPEELEELENEETSEGNPVIYYDWDSNQLILFWVTMRGAGDKSGWSACIIKSKFSKDNGKTWSEPRIIRDMIGWMIRNKPIWLSNGEFILPIMAEIGVGKAMVYRITKEDFMKGMDKSKIQEPDFMIDGGVSQPTIVETSPGKLLCFMRSHERTLNCPFLISTSRSEDYGHTWSEIQPTKEKIPNPDSGTDMVKLANGHIVLLCNPMKKGRKQLTAFLSEDNGETFPYRKDLEPIESGKNYHYPAVIQSKDGLIHVTYTMRRLNIKYACFNEEWIKQ